jgi:hypothetical protein
MPEIRNWKWDPHEKDAGKAEGNAQGGPGSNSKAAGAHE